MNHDLLLRDSTANRRQARIPHQRAGDPRSAFLTEAYHHVKHTVPLLMAVGSRLPERLEWLRTAVAGYIAEEQGHQEWVLADIAAEAVRHGQPRLATEVMVSYA